MRIFLLVLLILFAACNQNGADKDESDIRPGDGQVKDREPVFAKVDPGKSNIRFSNTLTHDVSTRENLFDYDYFYNGAGVGIEDLNNDGLPDLFFCGNQVANKLFLNKGDLVFEDASANAQIDQRTGWSNGVTFADVNADGWMDIYVSQGGPKEREERKNLLYINQQDGTFTEEAASYGLDDTGISTQSAFFDFDKDGDLDCIVMNENEYYGLDPVSLYRMVETRSDGKYYNSSHFYRNDKGKFVDITRQAGIERPIFGLGLAVSDINEDGWLDIYIASDYYIPDALFVNNGDGTFTDNIKEYTQQTSYYGMGIDIADINNDNLQDIFILDMASSDHVRSKTLMASMSTGRFDYLVNQANFQYQYMYNSLQLNVGDNTFNNIAQLTETANTDWSWAVIMSDFDLDEDKEIYVTNGYRRYALDNDLQRKVFEARQRYGNNVPLSIKNDLYNAMPSEKLPNILYENQGGLTFENNAKLWGLADFSFSNGAATGDLDNDGDLDIVVNNMDEEAFLYKNNAVEQGLGNYLKVRTIGNTSESFAKVELFYDGKSQLLESKRVRGYMSSLPADAHFGLGGTQTIDTVRVTWLNGTMEEKLDVPANSALVFRESDALMTLPEKQGELRLFKQSPSAQYGLDFVHKENVYDDFSTEVLLPYKQSNLGPFMAAADIDGDGLEDLYVGGASGQPGQLYIQTAEGFKKIASRALENDRTYEDMEAVFFDLEGDGDLDLYVVSGGYEFAENSSLYTDRVYRNDGSGGFARFDSPALTAYPKSGRAVVAFDFDQDGDEDILVGNRLIPKQYPRYSPSVLYENTGGQLKDVTSEKAPVLLEFGMINDLIATDFNNDGWMDVMAVGEWTDIGIFQNIRGRFEVLSGNEELLNDKGWWYSVTETDVNNDGLKDYVVGNIGLNIKFKAAKNKPFKIYATDFDDNGTNDIVLSKKYNETYVPVRGRECSSQQMPFIQEKFPTYAEFANASLTDIYGDKLKQSYEREVTEFKSVLLINLGNGSFRKSPLPVEAQIFPVMATITEDFNSDGFEDLVLAGNIYETEVETPRLDAVSGLVLLSDGKGGYLPQPHVKSGLYLRGNVKDILKINRGETELLLSTANNGPLGVHLISGPVTGVLALRR
jgi:hypothetical protein